MSDDIKYKEEVKMEICEICGKECKSEFGLRVHMRTHKKEKKSTEHKTGNKKYVVYTQKGGYKSDEVKLPYGQVVAVTEKQLEALKSVRNVREVKLGKGVRV